MTLIPNSNLSNFEKLLNLKHKYGLTNAKIATLTEYGSDSVSGWFAGADSARHREVPERALSLLSVKLENHDLKTANRELRERLSELGYREDTPAEEPEL